MRGPAQMRGKQAHTSGSEGRCTQSTSKSKPADANTDQQQQVWANVNERTSISAREGTNEGRGYEQGRER
jgi:hypothetical protein